MEDKLLNLTDNKNKTIVNILQLLSKEDKIYSLDNISEQINLSTRSTHRYVSVLCDLIQEYNEVKGPHFSLLQDHKGIQLAIDRQANINFLISYLLQNDETIKLLLSLLFQEYTSINEYIDKNFTGQYSINKSIESIDSLFKNYNLSIDKKKFEIIGSEMNIRFFMHNACWIIHRCDIWPEKFSMINIDLIKEDIGYITERLNISVNNPVKARDIMFKITISLMRYRKKCVVKLEDEMKQYVPLYRNNYDNPTLFETVESILKKHHVFNNEETYFLVITLLTNRLIYQSSNIKKQLYNHHRRLETNVFKSTNLFINEFEKNIVEIPNEKIDSVFDFIFRSHLTAEIQPEHFNDYNSYIFDGIKGQHTEYVQQLKLIIRKLGSTYDLKLFNNEDYLLNRYIMLNFFLNIKLLYKKTIKIKLYTDFPEIYEDYIKNYITTYFKNDYKISFIENETYQEYDLLLTSFLLNNNQENVLNISYPLNNRELGYLKNKFYEIDSSEMMTRI